MQEFVETWTLSLAKSTAIRKKKIWTAVQERENFDTEVQKLKNINAELLKLLHEQDAAEKDATG